jgi:hypothetical protein
MVSLAVFPDNFRFMISRLFAHDVFPYFFFSGLGGLSQSETEDCIFLPAVIIRPVPLTRFNFLLGSWPFTVVFPEDAFFVIVSPYRGKFYTDSAPASPGATALSTVARFCC